MNSNSFSNLVIKKDEDVQELQEYKEMIDSMTLEEFITFTNGYSLDKSYEASKVNIRKSYINMYYKEWIESTYRDFLMDSINSDKDLDLDMADLINTSIKKYGKNMDRDSSKRMESLLFMIFEIQPLRRSDYTCTVFSVKKTGSDKATNYAYLYSKIIPVTDNFQTSVSRITHEYFCTGPNLLSADGEYRNRFTNMTTLEYVKLNYADMWDEVEEYLKNRPKVKFSQNVYLASSIGDSYIEDFKNDINGRRYAMELLIVAWLSQGLISFLKLQNNHVDTTYNTNMFDPGDERFIAHLIEIYGIDKLKLFYWESGYITKPIKQKTTDKEALPNPTAGQKIIPFSEEESNNVGDIRYPVWREYHILEKISDLFINRICPGIPITHDWFYISGIDKNMFNNPKLFNRMLISDEAGPDDSGDIIVSDRGILIISEYVGRTVNDIASSMKSEEYRSSVGSMFSKPDEFSKYLFDITYALLCMNSKLNIIHGDLHLNNTTIQHVFKTYIHGKKNQPDKNITYVLGKEVFVFKDYGRTGTVIDFSRGFIIPAGAEYLQLKQSQSERILNYYTLLFPEFMKSFGDKLKNKLYDDFEQVYKIFSAIDMYIHTDRLIKFTEKHEQLQAHKKVKELIMHVNNTARHYLEVVMESVVNNTATSSKKMKYPNYDILIKCFGDYIVTSQSLKSSKTDLSDIYFYNNKIRYSLSSYDKLPPRIKYTKLKKHGEPTVMDIPFVLKSTDELITYYNAKKTVARF
jgi:hypothetical protein